jgi:ADP-heptose:LPS heptosyltransferase
MWYENFNEESANFLQKLKARNKTVITTKKIEDYPCTLDYNLSVVEIGKLAKNVKNVVSVNTGPLHLTMNRWSLDVINTFTIWSPKETFGYNEKFKRVKSLGELNESNI